MMIPLSDEGNAIAAFFSNSFSYCKKMFMSFVDTVSEDISYFIPCSKPQVLSAIFYVSATPAATAGSVLPVCHLPDDWSALESKMREDPESYYGQRQRCRDRIPTAIPLLRGKYAPFSPGQDKEAKSTEELFQTLQYAASNMIFPGFLDRTHQDVHAGIKLFTLSYTVVPGHLCNQYKEMFLSLSPNRASLIESLAALDIPKSQYDAAYLALATMSGNDKIINEAPSLSCMVSSEIPVTFHPEKVILGLTHHYDNPPEKHLATTYDSTWNKSFYEKFYGDLGLNNSILVTLHQALQKLETVKVKVDKGSQKGMRSSSNTEEDSNSHERVFFTKDSVDAALAHMKTNESIEGLVKLSGIKQAEVKLRNGKPPAKSKEDEEAEFRTPLIKLRSKVIRSVPELMAVFSYGYLYMEKSRSVKLVNDEYKLPKINSSTFQRNIDTAIVMFEAIMMLDYSPIDTSGQFFSHYFKTGASAVLARIHDDPASRRTYQDEASEAGLDLYATEDGDTTEDNDEDWGGIDLNNPHLEL